MEMNSVYSVDSNIEVNEVDERVVIIEPSGTEIYVLNREEKEIFLLFDGVNTLADIDEKLHEEYGEGYVREELLLYVESLLEKRILSVV